MHEVLPRTFALAGVELLDFEQRCAAGRASLQHHHAVLSHDTAGSRLEVWRRDRRRVINVLSSTKWRPGSAPWVRYHSTDELSDEEILVVDQLEQTNVVRTCLDLGTTLTRWQLAHVLYEAEFRYALDLDELHARNDARPRQHGKAVVRAAIADRRAGSAGTRSATEDRLLRLIIAAGLPIPIVCNPCATPLVEHECDFVWTKLRVIVEVDGTTGHRRAGRREGDAARDESYCAIGWTTVRITSDTIWEAPEHAVALVAAALAGAKR